MSKIAYKGFDVNKNNQLYCRNMIYELNKEYVIDGNLELCKNGMHFCWKLEDVDHYYEFEYSTICEVEILGNVIEGKNTACTNKLKILRILSKDEVMELSNDGIGNNGYCNKGNNNKGDYNKGNNNIGDSNRGNGNKGNGNRGNGNEGYANTGNNNIGSRNEGNNNKGNGNDGNCNEGNNNKGNGNEGIYNKGNNNTGDRNIGNNIIGFFNTISDIGSLDNIALFNKLSNISMEEFKQMKVYKLMDDIDFWCKFPYTVDDPASILPNFDKDIFREIPNTFSYFI